jgi:hypothetical protein
MPSRRHQEVREWSVVVVGESYQSVWLWDVGGRKEEEGKRREEKKIYPR